MKKISVFEEKNSKKLSFINKMIIIYKIIGQKRYFFTIKNYLYIEI